MRDFLFAVPWWAPTLIAIIGIALFVSGNRRQKDRTRTAGLAVIGLGILWAIVSYLVDTPKEICERQTRQFVRAVVDRDWNTFQRLLEPQADFKFVGSDWEIDGRDELLAAMQVDVDQIGLRGAHITSLQPDETPAAIVVRIRVYSTQDISMGQPLDSEWEMEWRKPANNWLLHEVRGLRVANIPPELIRGSLRKR